MKAGLSTDGKTTIKIYILTDGLEEYEEREMTVEEYREANLTAKVATDGNLFWCPQDKIWQ